MDRAGEQSGKHRPPGRVADQAFLAGLGLPNDLSLPPGMSVLAAAHFVGYVNYGATSWQLVTPIQVREQVSDETL